MNQKAQLVDAVLKSAGSGGESDDRKRLSCTQAFELAKKFDTEIIEIGRICNRNNIRICKCQLGCFA